MRQGRAASPGQHPGGAGSSVPVPPVHEAQAQDVVPAHQIVFFRQGIAAAGGTAQPGVQHAPPVLPAAGADGDAHRIVPPGGQAAAGILPGREVHVDQLHLHRGIHPAPGQRVPGGELQSEQVPGRPAAGVGLVPGGTGSVQTGQHGVPYPELGALVGHGIAGSADVQPQGIGTYRIAGVQLGAAPGRRLPQAAQQKSERKADAQVLHLPPGKHLTHKKTDPSSGNDIQRMGL